MSSEFCAFAHLNELRVGRLDFIKWKRHSKRLSSAWVHNCFAAISIIMRAKRTAYVLLDTFAYSVRAWRCWCWCRSHKNQMYTNLSMTFSPMLFCFCNARSIFSLNTLQPQPPTTRCGIKLFYKGFSKLVMKMHQENILEIATQLRLWRRF